MCSGILLTFLGNIKYTCCDDGVAKRVIIYIFLRPALPIRFSTVNTLHRHVLGLSTQIKKLHGVYDDVCVGLLSINFLLSHKTANNVHIFISYSDLL